MAKKYWLVKQEPEAYSWDDFVGENGCEWDGVRNYQARNNLRAMSLDDFVLFYHSVIGKEVVGIATVEREAYPDPTATKGDWSAVDLRPFKPINRPVSLETIKNDPQLSEIPLVRNSRLSVMPLEAKHFRRVLKLGNTIL